MILLLILPILTAGFLICNNSPKYYYRLHRYEGQHLYLKAAWLGLRSFLIATIVMLLINRYVPATVCGISIDLHQWLTNLFGTMGLSVKQAQEYSWILILSIALHIVAYASCVYRRKETEFRSGKAGIDSKILSMYEILKDSPLDVELCYSYIFKEPILISLSNRKVYVGIAVSLGEPNENEGMDQEISIAPLMSGYRDQQTLNAVFDTDYQNVDSDNEFKVTIRQELIDSVSKFDFDVYQKFQQQKQAKKQKTKVTFKPMENSFIWTWHP